MRKLSALALVAILGVSGCRMCCCPYDDCYPVIENQYQPSDGPMMEDSGYAAANATGARVAAAQSQSDSGPQLSQADASSAGWRTARSR